MTSRILAISSKFKHHAVNGGYIQLAKYIKPKYLIGIDETSSKDTPYLLKAYKWLYEFIGWWKFRHTIDLVHIYYGEEYFRFSCLLFRKKKIVATFHQPPERLHYEITKGGDGGRIYRLAHRLTKNRFKKLDAAIVLEESQKEVLEKVMPSNKIHVIYHGISLQDYTSKSYDSIERNTKTVLTIGNWLRDWTFYEKVIKLYEKENPSLTFKLINKQLEDEVLNKLLQYKNFKYLTDINDQQLNKEIVTAQFLFLPLISAAGNNAVMEGLALGKPLLMPDIFHKNYQLSCDAVILYEKHNLDHCLTMINSLLKLDEQEYQRISAVAKEKIKEFTWEVIANKTTNIINEI